MGGKEAFTSPPASRKRRVTPSIGKRKRRQEELTDQPRRSKRRQIYSDPTSIPVTPSAPSSSIRDTARISSVSGSGGSREYTGSTYSLEAVLSKRTLSSPHPGHADATEKPGDETAVSNGPRHCYCDEYCQACTSITPCELHDGFYCSGCDDWFHAACTGWEIKGEFPNRYMESKMYPDFKISLDSLSQEDRSLIMWGGILEIVRNYVTRRLGYIIENPTSTIAPERVLVLTVVSSHLVSSIP